MKLKLSSVFFEKLLFSCVQLRASHVRSSALALAGTPILLLAHHLTDVIAGCLRLSAARSVDRRSPSGPRGCGRGLVLCQPRSSCGRLSRERQREASLQRADVTPKVNAAGLRRLAGVPIVANVDDAGWERRKTGSAALECALVAAGLLEPAVVLFGCRMVATGCRELLCPRQSQIGFATVEASACRRDERSG
jgi:hypothetical protein